jgi:Leucine Rich repeat
MHYKVTVIFTLTALFLCGCGYWPPVVNTKHDVERVSTSEPAVRARGLSDGDIPSLAHLRHLDDLDFASGYAIEPARITDSGLAQLSKLDLPELKTLSLGYCDNITDTGLNYVARMRSVTWLSLEVCPRITDAGLKSLVTMTNLTGLDVRGCGGITDMGLDYLSPKTNWQTIWFGGCSNVTIDAVTKLQRALPNARIEKDDREWSFHK